MRQWCFRNILADRPSFQGMSAHHTLIRTCLFAKATGCATHKPSPTQTECSSLQQITDPHLSGLLLTLDGLETLGLIEGFEDIARAREKDVPPAPSAKLMLPSARCLGLSAFRDFCARDYSRTSDCLVIVQD